MNLTPFLFKEDLTYEGAHKLGPNMAILLTFSHRSSPVKGCNEPIDLEKDLPSFLR